MPVSFPVKFRWSSVEQVYQRVQCNVLWTVLRTGYFATRERTCVCKCKAVES